MSLRQRERINRSYDTCNCDACGGSQYDVHMRRKRVSGRWRQLCSTCASTLRREGERGLKAFLRVRAYHGDADVSDEVYDSL